MISNTALHWVASFVMPCSGVDSYTAIRANELCLPAVTGAGEAHYDAWSHVEVLA